MSSARTAIVAGAGSGIGRATAVLLAQAGFDLVLAGRTEAKLQETAALARRSMALPGQVVTQALDLCAADAGRQLVDQAMNRLGRIDALANIAGYASLKSVPQVEPAEWRRTIDGNVSYVMNLTAAVWPMFAAQHSGVIVNVSSMASVDPFPGFAMYAAAKTALNMFTRVTAREGCDIGVRAVAIAPGAVETPMLRALFDTGTVPAERALAPQMVATVIRDCITGARSFVPGDVIPVPSP